MNKIKIFILICFFAFIFLLSFQSCKKVTFSENINDKPNPSVTERDPLILADVKAACENTAHKTKTKLIRFNNPGYICQWSQDGNLRPLSGRFQARIEQSVSLELPSSSLICDTQFSFSQQSFIYDDHFIFLINDTIIAASYDFSYLLETRDNGLLKYDWRRIVGQAWDLSKEQAYCPQILGANATCSFPRTQTQGLINLNYDPAYLQNIMTTGIPDKHEFRLITTGDNDNHDCSHSYIEFIAEIRYVER